MCKVFPSNQLYVCLIFRDMIGIYSSYFCNDDIVISPPFGPLGGIQDKIFIDHISGIYFWDFEQAKPSSPYTSKALRYATDASIFALLDFLPAILALR